MGVIMVDGHELTFEQAKVVDDILERMLHKGNEAIKELGENFMPYLKIMLKDDVTNPKEQAIILGVFLSLNKIEKDGYKLISKNKFSDFFQEFKHKMK
jgi:hypothetical protein